MLLQAESRRIGRLTALTLKFSVMLSLPFISRKRLPPLCHVEQAKRSRNISRKRCLINGTTWYKEEKVFYPSC